MKLGVLQYFIRILVPTSSVTWVLTNSDKDGCTLYSVPRLFIYVITQHIWCFQAIKKHLFKIHYLIHPFFFGKMGL